MLTTRAAVDAFVEKHLSRFAYDVVLIQHLKRDTVQFVTSLINHGANVPLVVAIPYSIESEAKQTLKGLGVRLLEPSLLSIAEETIECLQSLSSSGRQVVVQEVGGYLAQPAADGLLPKSVVCVIEETKNGLWRYQHVGHRLTIPVIEVADTEMKRVEAHFVGEAVCEAIATHLFRHQETLRYKRVGLVGYGDIGTGVAEAMLRRRIIPTVFDRDQIRMAGALTAGCWIGNLAEVINLSDVIVGATGQTCFAADDLQFKKDIRFFASASSRDIEFPLRDMSARFENKVELGDIRYSGVVGELVVLASGFPINFTTRSLPPNISDLLFLLVSSAMKDFEKHNPGPGLHRLDREMELEAAKYFLQFHPTRSS